MKRCFGHYYEIYKDLGNGTSSFICAVEKEFIAKDICDRYYELKYEKRDAEITAPTIDEMFEKLKH